MENDAKHNPELKHTMESLKAFDVKMETLNAKHLKRDFISFFRFFRNHFTSISFNAPYSEYVLHLSFYYHIKSTPD